MPEQTYLVITLRIPTENVETATTMYTRIKMALSAIAGIIFSAKLTIQMDTQSIPN